MKLSPISRFVYQYYIVNEIERPRELPGQIIALYVFCLFLVIFLLFFACVLRLPVVTIPACLLVFVLFDSRTAFVALLNNVVDEELPQVTMTAVEIHANLWIADLHADSILFSSIRPLEEPSDFGHVDFPRLRQGGVQFQVFGIVTSSPNNQRLLGNPAPTWYNDSITAVAVLSGWPRRTWTSTWERALYQLTDRKLTYAVEGLHCLEGDLSRLRVLAEKGVRIGGLVHFFDNEVAGSMHGVERRGLTKFGRAVVHEMISIGMWIDLSHSSFDTIDDVLNIASGKGAKLLVSHTGSETVCPGGRNLDDGRLFRICSRGGLIGVSFFSPAVCGPHLFTSILDTIEHMVNICGVERVALGSDFDGTEWTPFDSAEAPFYLIQGLLSRQWTKNHITQVMGENIRREFIIND